MSGPPEWLPALVRLDDFDGNWDRFLAELYGVFYRDFRSARPLFRGRAVVHDTAISEGKEEGFWHVISEVNRDTGVRNIGLHRCERLAWVRAIVEHADDPAVSVWSNTRGTHKRVLLWLEYMDYLVVLEERPRVFVLITAYCTDSERTRRKLRKERGHT